MNKTPKLSLLVLIFLTILTVAPLINATECGTTPTDGCEVTSDTTFDYGGYNLPNGIVTGANNVNIDCNGAILHGNNSGVGVNVLNSNVILRNCTIVNNSVGVLTSGNPSNGFQMIGNTLLNNTMNANIWDTTTNVRIVNNIIGLGMQYGYLDLGFDVYYENNLIIDMNLYGTNKTIINNRITNVLLKGYSPYFENYNYTFTQNTIKGVFQTKNFTKEVRLYNNYFNQTTFFIDKLAELDFCYNGINNTYYNVTYTGVKDIDFNCPATPYALIYHFNETFNGSSDSFNTNNANPVSGSYPGYPYSYEDLLTSLSFRSTNQNYLWTVWSNYSTSNSNSVIFNGDVVHGVNMGVSRTVGDPNTLYGVSVQFTPINMDSGFGIGLSCQYNGHVSLESSFLVLSDGSLNDINDKVIGLRPNDCNDKAMAGLENLSCCDMSDIIAKDCNSNLGFYPVPLNISVVDIAGSCTDSGFNLNNWANVSRLDIITLQQGIDSSPFPYSYYDNIVIYSSNTTIAPNTYPQVNLTQDKEVYCLNDSTISVTMNVSAYDAEGDTVLYARSLGVVKNETKTVRFTQGFSIPYFEYVDLYTNDLKDFYVPNTATSCTIDTSLIYTQDIVNQSFIFFKGYDKITGTDVYYLHLRNSCTKPDKSINYLLGNIDNAKVTATILNGGGNQNFNITFKDLDYSIINGVNVQYDDNTNELFIFDLNTNLLTTLALNDTWAGVFSIEGFYNGGIVFKYAEYGKEDNILFTSEVLPNLANAKPAYYSITLGDTSYILLRKFLVNKIMVSLNLQNSVNLTTVYDTPGVKTFTLYYSDTPHLPGYRFITKNVNVYSANLCPNLNNDRLKADNDNLLVYDPKGKTGIALTLDTLVYFLRFPYNFFKLFGFQEMASYAVTIAYVFFLGWFYYENQRKQGFLNAQGLVIIGFFLGGLLFIMNLLLLPVFVVILFLFANVVYRSLIKHDGTG